MRPLLLLVASLTAGSAPYATHYELERTKSLLYLGGALGLAALAYTDPEEPAEDDGVVEGLVLAAAVPLMRRSVAVLHDVRLSMERLDALFGSDVPSFNSPLNIMADLRFRREDLGRLLVGLRLPHSFTTPGRHRFAGVEGLLILLKRMRYPQRLVDISGSSGRGMSALSECITVRTLTCSLRLTLRS